MNPAREFAAEIQRRAALSHPGESPEQRAKRYALAFDTAINHLEHLADQHIPVAVALALQTKWMRQIEANRPNEMTLEDSL